LLTLFRYLYYFSTNANSRNFAAQFYWIRRVIEKFLLSFRIPGETVFTEMIRRMINKELPDGNRETKWLILPGSLPAFLFLFLRDFWSVQHDTRNICVTCIFHRANGFPVTIVNIGGSIPFLQDDREYRRLSANTPTPQTREPEGRWEGSGKSGEETGSLSQPLACRYYTTGWISLGSDVTLFATNRRWLFSINRGDEAGARLFSSAINYK